MPKGSDCGGISQPSGSKRLSSSKQRRTGEAASASSKPLPASGIGDAHISGQEHGSKPSVLGPAKRKPGRPRGPAIVANGSDGNKMTAAPAAIQTDYSADVAMVVGSITDAAVAAASAPAAALPDAMAANPPAAGPAAPAPNARNRRPSQKALDAAETAAALDLDEADEPAAAASGSDEDLPLAARLPADTNGVHLQNGEVGEFQPPKVDDDIIEAALQVLSSVTCATHSCLMHCA